MGYSFLAADASVEAAARRIAVERIDDAVAALDAARPDAVHTVRKRMKQARALARLVGARLPHPRREDRDFRDIARILSASRDAQVLAATFDDLAKSAARPLDVDTAYAIRKSLADQRGAGPDAAAKAEVIARLGEARERVAAWSLRSGGWSALEEGLLATYAGARKMMRAALKRGDDETVHAWRKEVKAHYHHLELLQPTWAKALKAQVKAANRLQEALGEHHDAALLAAHVERHADDYGGERAIVPILALLDARRAGLIEEAQALGARLFAEEPNAFATRLKSYWKEWRRELRAGEAQRLAA